MNINWKQVVSILGGIVSVLVVSTAQLSDLLGPDVAKKIVTIAGLINMALQAYAVSLTTQSRQVTDVAAMPGVEKITVNPSASPALARVATDQDQPKVGGTTPAVQALLEEKGHAV